MRTVFVLFSLLLLNSIAFSQIPNAGFENWTGDSPNEWWPNNFTSLWQTIFKSTDAHSGTSAARGEVVTAQGSPIEPLIRSGISGTGFSITSRPASIKGYYKFNSVGGDEFFVAAFLYDNATLIGGGSFETNISTSNYIQFGADITYVSEANPTNCIISILASNDEDANVGTYFIVDDLEFSNDIVGVKDKNIVYKFSLHQNFPNPFNPSTRIKYEVPAEDMVVLKVYDLIGNEVTTLVNEVKPAGTYYADFNGSGLSNGVYIYSLNSGPNRYTRKMILLK